MDAVGSVIFFLLIGHVPSYTCHSTQFLGKESRKTGDFRARHPSGYSILKLSLHVIMPSVLKQPKMIAVMVTLSSRLSLNLLSAGHWKMVPYRLPRPEKLTLPWLLPCRLE